MSRSASGMLKQVKECGPRAAPRIKTAGERARRRSRCTLLRSSAAPEDAVGAVPLGGVKPSHKAAITHPG